MQLFKSHATATPELKAKILHAMTHSAVSQNFVGYFSSCDFSLIPTTNEPEGLRIWSAQKGDVTVLIWEQDREAKYWPVKLVCW